MHPFYSISKLFALEAIFWFIHQFFFKKNTWIFGFFYVPHLADNHAKIVDERGRNLMCDRFTLPSRLVSSSCQVNFALYKYKKYK